MFEAATRSVLRDRASTLFWTDKWLPDGPIYDIAPNMFGAVSRQTVRSRRAREGLVGGWLEDISPYLSAQTITELMEVADKLAVLELIPELEDTFEWTWDARRLYSARSCYAAYFRGLVAMSGAPAIWRSKAPSKCKIFLWLALRGRC